MFVAYGSNFNEICEIVSEMGRNGSKNPKVSNINKKAQLMQGLHATARDSAVIPRWPSAAIFDIIESEIVPFDPPTPKTLA